MGWENPIEETEREVEPTFLHVCHLSNVPLGNVCVEYRSLSKCCNKVCQCDPDKKQMKERKKKKEKRKKEWGIHVNKYKKSESDWGRVKKSGMDVLLNMSVTAAVSHFERSALNL